jgi:hypothetical protein
VKISPPPYPRGVCSRTLTQPGPLCRLDERLVDVVPHHPARVTTAHPGAADAVAMAIDTLIAYAGVYGNVEDAEADYRLVHELHT